MSIVQPRIQSEPETWEIPENDLTRWAESFLKPMAQLAWEGKGQLNPGEKQRRRGKKLDKAEEEFCRENPDLIKPPHPKTEEELRLLALLGE